MSLGFLRRFLAAHVLPRPDGTQLSTLDVVLKVIKPLTQPHCCRLVDLPEIHPPGLLVPERGDVGPPDYFISHAWSMPLVRTVHMVLEQLQVGWW